MSDAGTLSCARALALLASACAHDPPAASRPIAAAPVRPAVVAPVREAPLVPAIPILEPGTCVSGDRPTHHLVVTATDRFLDDVRLGREIALDGAVKSRVEDHRLTLEIDPELSFVVVRSLLVELQAVPGLRLWIGVRVGDDRRIQHIPILPTRLDAPAYLVGLPPATYSLRLDGEREVFDGSIDPFMLPPGRDVLVDQLLVIPGDASPWRIVAAALAIPCGGATVIDPPLQYHEHWFDPIVRLRDVTTTGDAAYQDTSRRILRAHVNEIRLCYNLARRRNPRTRGRVTVAFTVDARGKVASASVAESTVVDNDLDLCIAAAVRRWSFVKPEAGRELSVRCSWSLEPG